MYSLWCDSTSLNESPMIESTCMSGCVRSRELYDEFGELSDYEFEELPLEANCKGSVALADTVWKRKIPLLAATSLDRIHCTFKTTMTAIYIEQ